MTRPAGRARGEGAAAVLALGLLVGCGAVDSREPAGPLTGSSLVEAARDGGLVLYLRHTATDDRGEDAPDPLGDCTRQRLLTDAGRQDARALGAALRRLDVPIGDVAASPFCRTAETAELAFGRVRADDRLLGPAPGGGDREQKAEALRRLVGEVPPEGRNTVLVGHLTNLRLVSRASPDEGGTVVLRPDGDGRFLLVAEVPVQGWQKLADRHAAPDSASPAGG